MIQSLLTFGPLAQKHQLCHHSAASIADLGTLEQSHYDSSPLLMFWFSCPN